MSKDIAKGKTEPTPPAVAPAAAGVDERAWYWVGCDLDGPQHRYQLAGVTFQHSIDKLVEGQVTSTSVPQLGAVESLTAEQVARVKLAAHRDVVRSVRGEGVPDGGVKQLLTASTRRYTRHAGDYPVGRHVYLTPVDRTFVPPRLDGKMPDRLIGESDAWIQPEREVDPIITAERERAKIQAEAIAQAVQSLQSATAK